MKRNLTVLVLLAAWSLFCLPSLSRVALAGEIMENGESVSGPIQNDIVVEDDGAPDDDNGGDPGDGGDGYGFTQEPDLIGPSGGSGNCHSLIPDELRLILMSPRRCWIWSGCSGLTA